MSVHLRMQALHATRALGCGIGSCGGGALVHLEAAEKVGAPREQGGLGINLWMRGGVRGVNEKYGRCA